MRLEKHEWTFAIGGPSCSTATIVLGLTPAHDSDDGGSGRASSGATAAAPTVDAGAPGTWARYDSLTRSDLLTYKPMPTPNPTATAAIVVDATRPVDPSLVMPAPFALCVLSILSRGF